MTWHLPDDGWCKQPKHVAVLNKGPIYWICTIVFVSWYNTLIKKCFAYRLSIFTAAQSYEQTQEVCFHETCKNNTDLSVWGNLKETNTNTSSFLTVLRPPLEETASSYLSFSKQILTDRIWLKWKCIGIFGLHVKFNGNYSNIVTKWLGRRGKRSCLYITPWFTHSFRRSDQQYWLIRVGVCYKYLPIK